MLESVIKDFDSKALDTLSSQDQLSGSLDRLVQGMINLLIFRFCDYTNDQTNLKGKTLSAALMSGAKFDGADMTEVVMSKAYAVGTSFKGVNFSNAVIDRVNFGKSDLKGAVFKNTVLSGSTFEEANLEDVIFRTQSLVT